MCESQQRIQLLGLFNFQAQETWWSLKELAMVENIHQKDKYETIEGDEMSFVQLDIHVDV